MPTLSMLTRLKPALVCGVGIAVAATIAEGGRPVAAARSTLVPQAVKSPSPDGQVAAPAGPTESAASSQRALLNRYCVGCHNERLKTADLMLDKADVEHVADNVEIWEKVVGKLRKGAMPPAGRPRPDNAAVAGLVGWLESEIDRAAAAHPNPGRPALHRLNRSEYTNAIRDLLGLEIDGRALLPADDRGYGFDNIADVLTVSPGLLERYISAAQKISRIAVGDSAIRPIVELHRPFKNDRQEDRPSEDLPWGTRGGLAVRRYFPVDGEYSVKVRFIRPPSAGYFIRGFQARNEIELRLDRAPLARFTIGGGATSASTGNNNDGAMRDERQDTNFAYSQLAAGVSIHHSSADEPDAVEVRFPLQAGSHVVGVALSQKTLQPEGLAPRLPTADYSYQRDPENPAAVDSIEIGGPHHVKQASANSPSRRQIFVCRPTNTTDEERCAKTILSKLARRAYRRPVTDDDLQTLLRFWETDRRERGFDGGIQAALEVILANPQFLFRAEREPASGGSSYRLSDLELASRLSFFLWSSIPDEELLELATRGKLKDPTVLAQQVRRMLDDARSKEIVNNFAGQWLYLRNLSAVVPDTHEFPDFDDELRSALQRETELFFESQLREDRPVIDLLRADYTFLNERLAKHYGIPNVYGSHFRRVTLTDPARMGLLGQGSILTVTSYANRTSPVLRGKWMLENIIGAPPPAPPPDVPPLKEEPGVKYQSMRERMEQHRKNPVCATCHAQIDPLGFAMENFDAVGHWRSRIGDKPIDVSGALPDGTAFSGSVELRKLLVSRQEEFVSTLTQKLLTYGLGRGVEYYDMPAVRQIMREAEATDYRWSSLILGIVRSTPFQMRRAQS